MQISRKSNNFRGMLIPDEDSGLVVGYAALIDHYELPVPLPYLISLVSKKNRKKSTSSYKLYPSTYQPEERTYDHIVFALKYEGLNLLVLKKLFEVIKESEVIKWIKENNTGQFGRKIWYLYEWLLDINLKQPDADTKINYVSLADDKVQYTIQKGLRSKRHRIINNLPGDINFCPHVYKTEKLTAFEALQLHLKENQIPENISKSLLSRSSAYLLLKDSKASFAIEGENPKSNKLNRWGRAVSQAGLNNISKQELERLQLLILPAKTKVKKGYRTTGGFIGEHDQDTFEPIPEHISARWEDLEKLMDGLIQSTKKLNEDPLNAVVVAAMASFGFVFMHPFSDANGRIHRYLIHHILAKKKFSREGLIFPVSAAIEKDILKYKHVLEKYSSSLLDFVEWKTTDDHNVEVLNDTIDYYRYFDATHLAEYLYECIEDTIKTIIPEEIDLLRKYDAFKEVIEEEIGLADNDIDLLSKFLRQNDGTLSQTKKTKFFEELNDEDIHLIESTYHKIYFEN